MKGGRILRPPFFSQRLRWPSKTCQNNSNKSPRVLEKIMAAYQYVYVMDRLSKTYAGGKQVLKDIRLSFLPGAKIGIVGVNGSGKSTLLKIMAGKDKDFQGEAWAAEGAKVGYLEQEPQLNPDKDVRGNVMEGVAEKQALLDRYNELAMNYSDET